MNRDDLRREGFALLALLLGALALALILCGGV